MRPFARGEAPQILADNAEKWGEDWARRQKEGGAFHWRIVGGEPINRRLLPALASMTQEHCSFCDAFPVSSASLETIEHFRPKSKHPLEAYKWDNLYYCCDHCQNEKRETFSELENPVRPDEAGYCFDDFFSWNFADGILEANPNSAPENKRRAEAIINLYKLNNKHPRWRCMERRKLASQHLGASSMNPADWAYRTFLFQEERTTRTPPTTSTL